MSPRRRRPRRSRAALQRRRLLVLAGLCLAGYAGLAGRAFQLHAVDGEELSLRAARQHQSSLHLAPLRGELRDRSGVLLAGSASVSSIAASPRRIRDPDRVARRLARVLGADRAALRAKLRPSRGFVWIQRWVTPEQAERVRVLDLEGVHLHAERKRFYPSRTLAASYLGFAGRDGEGLSGIELAFDSTLRGTGSDLRALRDARGRKLIDVAARPQDRSGATVVLAIDAKLQHFTESALARALARTGARHGTVVVLDPQRGDVLAIAQAPGFDPNSFWLAKPDAWRARAREPGPRRYPASRSRPRPSG